MSILPKITRTDDSAARIARIRQDALRRHAKLGGQLFGPVPVNRQRQFFCLDKYTWIWHEVWVDEKGKQHSVSTRYDIRPNGIFKVQNGGHYQSMSATETRNLYKAATAYLQRLQSDYVQNYQSA